MWGGTTKLSSFQAREREATRTEGRLLAKAPLAKALLAKRVSKQKEAKVDPMTIHRKGINALEITTEYKRTGRGAVVTSRPYGNETVSYEDKT